MEELRGSRGREAQCWGAQHRDVSASRCCRARLRLLHPFQLFPLSRDSRVTACSPLFRLFPLPNRRFVTLRSLVFPLRLVFAAVTCPLLLSAVSPQPAVRSCTSISRLTACRPRVRFRVCVECVRPRRAEASDGGTEAAMKARMVPPGRAMWRLEP